MCYKSLFTVKKTQKEAIDICKNESSFIARPFSDDDRRFIQNLTGKEPFTGSKIWALSVVSFSFSIFQYVAFLGPTFI